MVSLPIYLIGQWSLLSMQRTPSIKNTANDKFKKGVNGYALTVYHKLRQFCVAKHGWVYVDPSVFMYM